MSEPLYAVLRFASGFPTLLQRHPRAALLRALLGPPDTLRRIRDGYRLEWEQRDERGGRLGASIHLGRVDEREAIALDVGPDVRAVALRFAESYLAEKSAAVLDAEEALESARSALAEAEQRRARCAPIPEEDPR